MMCYVNIHTTLDFLIMSDIRFERTSVKLRNERDEPNDKGDKK